MKSLKIMLVVLSVVGMTAGLAAVAQGDTIALWAGYDVKAATGAGVDAFSAAGAKLTPPSFTYGDGQSQGLAFSPDGAILYVASYNDNKVQTRNATTGALINAAFATIPIGVPNAWIRGLDVDSSGNIYVGDTQGYIHKITSGGTLTTQWGGRIGTSDSLVDVEIVGNDLYAAVALGNQGVVKYGLSLGGTPTQVMSGTRTEGLAQGPNGEWYTTDSSGQKAYSWDSSWGSKTEIGTGIAYYDVDYWNGDLYVAAMEGGVKKYDLGTATWSDLVPADSGKRVRFVLTVIPEPSTLVLLATGLIGLLCYAWRKRK